MMNNGQKFFFMVLIIVTFLKLLTPETLIKAPGPRPPTSEPTPEPLAQAPGPLAQGPGSTPEPLAWDLDLTKISKPIARVHQNYYSIAPKHR